MFVCMCSYSSVMPRPVGIILEKIERIVVGGQAL